MPEIQITLFHTKYNFFKNSFFPSTVIKLNELDRNLQSAASLSVFKKNLLNFIRPSRKSVFNCHIRKEIKYLTRLRLGLSHLCKHKFKHNFQDTVNPFCSCGLDVDTNTHFFSLLPLDCLLIKDEPLLNDNDIDSSLTNILMILLTNILTSNILMIRY